MQMLTVQYLFTMLLDFHFSKKSEHTNIKRQQIYVIIHVCWVLDGHLL